MAVTCSLGLIPELKVRSTSSSISAAVTASVARAPACSFSIACKTEFLVDEFGFNYYMASSNDFLGNE